MSNRLLAAIYTAGHWVVDRLLGASSSDVDMATVREGMDVISACGQLLGSVEHVYLFADRIVVRTVGGHDAYVPRGWVARVTDQVRLKLNGVESRDEWAASRAVCAA